MPTLLALQTMYYIRKHREEEEEEKDKAEDDDEPVNNVDIDFIDED